MKIISKSDNVQCSFCYSVFPNGNIVKKPIENKVLVRVLPAHMMEYSTIVKKDDQHIGEYCPICKHLHVVGFREY